MRGWSERFIGNRDLGAAQMHTGMSWGILAAASLSVALGGCATCKDHLHIHVEQAQTREPIAGARVEFRPPLSVLPPPVWRGKTDACGDLRICVDYKDGRALKMSIFYDGHSFGALFGPEMIAEPAGLEIVQEADGEDGPEIRFVVMRIADR